MRNCGFGPKVWLGTGVIIGIALAKLAPWGAFHLLDVIQAMDFR